MKNWPLVAACAAVVMLASAAPSEVAAQSTTGVMDGVVRDPDGAVLPGVAVVVNSPTLIQRDYTVYTDDTGYYRVPFLLPGVYEVAFSLDGFRTFSQSDVLVRVNQTTEQNASLELAAVTESVVVTGDAPIVDSRAAKLAFTYSEELVQEVPIQRTVNTLFATIPGVESNNSYGNVNQPGLVDLQNVLGAGERSNDYILDGANVADPATQWNTQMMMPYDIVEEVQVVKSAKPAEIPYQGGLFNIITKSGSNELHGQVGAYFVDEALQARTERISPKSRTSSPPTRSSAATKPPPVSAAGSSETRCGGTHRPAASTTRPASSGFRPTSTTRSPPFRAR